MVSSAAVTGAQHDFNEQKQAYFQKIEAMQLRNPRMIGFGISNRQTFETAAAHASGCIIGSKFVALLDEARGNAEEAAERLMAASKVEPSIKRRLNNDILSKYRRKVFSLPVFLVSLCSK